MSSPVPEPVVPKAPGIVSRVYKAVLAAVSSPDVVKAEKNIAVLVIVRVALSLGASAGLVEIIRQIAGI